MKAAALVSAAALWQASSTFAQSWKTIPYIEPYGQHFFYSNNGSQYYMKGVAYQQNYSPNGTDSSSNVQYTDPLANADNCKRDIPIMKAIFTNVIRVYALDPTQDHDDCMQQLADADIYVVADLASPQVSIQSNEPRWDETLLDRYTAVIDSMSKYNNVIGFFAGNEVITYANQTAAAAFVKAAVRDSKAYIKSRGYRTSLGVGYATADVPSRDELAHYFVCGDSSASIDFWGYNVYSWCGDSSYTKSSYDERTKFFSDYPVPVFFAEYGCNSGLPGGPYSRPFTEVPYLYGDLMTPVFSGGIVYEYFDDANKFGLVSVSGDSVSVYPDYSSLSSQLATVTPSSTMKSDYSATNTAPACPTNDASWVPQASPLPPAVNPNLCTCEYNSFGCQVSSSDETTYGSAFNYICSADPSACEAFVANATTGTYGALSGCSPKVQLGWAANAYYNKNNKNSDACNFSGVASVNSSPNTGSNCATLLQAAGTNGQGTVVAPTGSIGTSKTGSGGGMRMGAGQAPSFFEFGSTIFALYAGIAVIAGAGMIAL